MTFFITIEGEIQSRKLWELIECYHVNLTDLGDRTLVYGETNHSDFGEIISKCSCFGRITASSSN